MKKFIPWVIFAVIVVLLGFVLKGEFDKRNRSELISEVKSAVQEDISKDPSYSGVAIGNISLIRESSNKYTGYVDFKYQSSIERGEINVITEHGKLLYKMEPPRSIMAQKATEEISKAFKEEGPRDDGSAARSVLNTLSIASETYATANEGHYPTDVSKLLEGPIPYINQDYCGARINPEGRPGDYIVMCFFSEDGYKFVAMGEGNDPIYRIVTGCKKNW